jgi:hypothetical protein
MKVGYKILNYLFGWDYILWSNSADQGISRVITLHDGTLGYWRYKYTTCFDEIIRPRDVRWLTCDPEKYIKTEQKHYG